VKGNAMPTATAPAAAIQEAVLSSIKQGQELTLTSIGAWTDLAGKAFPLPAFETLPFATMMPEARELVDAGFGFATELLAVQKDFSEKLLDAVAPAKKVK
jgi:hypothetical protein